MACKAIPGNGPRKVHLYPGVRHDPKSSSECSLVHPARALWLNISPLNRCTSQEQLLMALLCAHTCPREVFLLFITTIQKAKLEQFKESARERWVFRHTERLVRKGRHPKMMVAVYTQNLEQGKCVCWIQTHQQWTRSGTLRVLLLSSVTGLAGSFCLMLRIMVTKSLGVSGTSQPLHLWYWYWYTFWVSFVWKTAEEMWLMFRIKNGFTQ